MNRRLWTALPVLAVLIIGLGTGFAGSAGADTTLTGTFGITAGDCNTMNGSFFRMILPTGGADGPYVSNPDSPCTDQTYSPLFAGTDRGLVTDGYQPSPDPAYDASGNGLANRITQPTPFYQVTFAASTEATDPQTGANTPPPSITVDGAGHLSGDLSAFGVWWNGQTFNQGSPKPNGSYPGNSTKLSGSYDAGTGAFSMTWLTQVVGGPFDNFTGVWHLEGKFASAGVAAPTTPGSADQSGAGASGAAATGTAGPTTVAANTGPSGGSGTNTAADGGAAGAGATTPTADATAVAGGEKVTTEVTTSGDDSRPPAWLVLLIAATGIGGALYLVWVSRSEALGSRASSTAVTAS